MDEGYKLIHNSNRCIIVYNFTSSRDIIAYLKTKNVNLSDTKIGRDLSKLGLTKDDKRIEGKIVRIMRGIKCYRMHPI